MRAFDRFTQFDVNAPTLKYAEGEYLAVLMVLGLSWSWVVWFKDRPMDGRRDWQMDAMEAAEEAVAAVERLKTSDRRPFFGVESI